MKIPDLNEFTIAWPKSLGVLQTKVLEFFKLNDMATDNVWFPDIELVLPKNLKDQKTIQVVLFGGFLDRVFETGNWADKKYLFWCMTPKVKQVLVELLDFPASAINVIPRYKLFPKVHPEKKIDLNSDLQIVYSGRLSAQKNIEMFLAFAAIFQEKMGKPVSILLLGEWDNHKPKSRGRFEFESYEEFVNNFQKNLNFIKSPVFINTLGHDEWMGELQENCLLVNFSTFYCEDFGVSIAQAESMGIPMLLSKWGAHCDIRAENVDLVDAKDIAESFLPSEKIILHAQIVVEKFLSNKLNKTFAKCESVESEHLVLSFEDLQMIRSKALKKYGQEIALLGKNLISLYAGSDSGKSFFKEYFKIFS